MDTTTFMVPVPDLTTTQVPDMSGGGFNYIIVVVAVCFVVLISGIAAYCRASRRQTRNPGEAHNQDIPTISSIMGSDVNQFRNRESRPSMNIPTTSAVYNYSDNPPSYDDVIKDQHANVFSNQAFSMTSSAEQQMINDLQAPPAYSEVINSEHVYNEANVSPQNSSATEDTIVQSDVARPDSEMPTTRSAETQHTAVSVATILSSSDAF